MTKLALNHSPECICGVADCPQSVYLSDQSPQDKPWDIHRYQADQVQRIYAQAEKFERYAQRIGKCSGVLRFAWFLSAEGEARLRLGGAQFCRCRYCPVCQWRRALMWQARFYQALPALLSAYPTHRWLFLTLTVQNPPVGCLRETLGDMTKAFKRLTDRTVWHYVDGFLRTTEVTLPGGELGHHYAHPHFHILLMVKPSYFTGGGYVKQARWSEVWKECLRADYQPVVHVQAVKPNKRKSTAIEPIEETGIQTAIQETLKYSVKPSDMVKNGEWFRTVTEQTHKLRFVASGGLLKDILKSETSITEEDMLLKDGEKEDAESVGLGNVFFNWAPSDKRYKRM